MVVFPIFWKHIYQTMTWENDVYVLLNSGMTYYRREKSNLFQDI